MTMSKLHSRETAIGWLNEFFEDLGVFEEDRIKVDESVEYPKFDDGISQAEKDKLILAYEKQDGVREKVIGALRRKKLEYDSESKEFKYSLESPIGTGDNMKTVLTFKRRYKERELERNMRGVKASDERATTQAYMATRCGIDRMSVGELMDDDMEVVQNVFLLFFRRG